MTDAKSVPGLRAVIPGVSPFVSPVTSLARRCGRGRPQARHGNGRLGQQLAQHDPGTRVQGELKLEIHTVFGSVLTPPLKRKAALFGAHRFYLDLGQGQRLSGIQARNLRLRLEIRL